MRAESPIYPRLHDQQRPAVDDLARMLGALSSWADRLDLARVMLGTGMNFGDLPGDPTRFAGWRTLLTAALERVPTAGRVRNVPQAIMLALTIHDEWRREGKAFIGDPASDAEFMVFAARNRWLEPTLIAIGDLSSAGYPAAHRFAASSTSMQ